MGHIADPCLVSSYDAVDQLTNVASAGGPSATTNYAYAYDLAGNRILAATNGVQTQYYYNALNQIAGSSITLTNVSYEWDAENRLTAINQGTHQSLFTYDGWPARRNCGNDEWSGHDQ